MAILRRIADDARFPIAARMLIGRSPACGIQVDEHYASGEHATLIWRGTGWEIRDLASRNGTFVDGARLESGATVPVFVGAQIGLGRPEGFELIDAEAPEAFATHTTTKAQRVARNGLLVLPSEESPELSIYQSNIGEWAVERSDEDVGTVEDQDVVAVSDGQWQLSLPVPMEGTPMAEPGPSLDNVSMRFAVSRNEEHVELTIVYGGREIPLEPHDHLYVLLTLARVRQSDHHLTREERGWVDRDELLKMLSMERTALNVAIHRARRQLLSAGIDGAAGIVEVRPRQRRFGTDRFQIASL